MLLSTPPCFLREHKLSVVCKDGVTDRDISYSCSLTSTLLDFTVSARSDVMCWYPQMNHDNTLQENDVSWSSLCFSQQTMLLAEVSGLLGKGLCVSTVMVPPSSVSKFSTSQLQYGIVICEVHAGDLYNQITHPCWEQ